MTAIGAVVAAATMVAGCSSGGSAVPSGRPSAAATATPPAPTSATPSSPPRRAGTAADVPDWPTYHGDDGRRGFTLRAGPRAPLRVAWRADLGAAVYAQPIVAAGLVVVATERDTVDALDPRTGHRRWHRDLGPPEPLADLPCGNIDPLGITGTPAYDAATRTVFVVTETTGAHHTLVALDVTTGRVKWRRDLDVVTGRDRAAQQQRAALLIGGGRVYVGFGGLYGDCGNYVGYVTAVATTGRGRVLRYAVPTQREAGIWAPPGLVAAPDGSLLVAVGNGGATGGRWDGSDSVLRLSPTLHRRAYFAPTTWPEDNAGDLDLGSMSPVSVGDRVVMAGKRGIVFLLPPALGGVGGQVATLDGCAAFGGAARRGSLVVLPCTDGLRALDVTGDTMRWRWRVAGVSGSPLITATTVWALDRSTGDLVAIAATNGALRARVHVGEVTRFATPAPAGSVILVGTTSGVVAVAGARR